MDTTPRSSHITSTPKETFIIVRPPPSKQNDPRNLQIQFLSPRPVNTQASSSRTSFTSTITADSFGAVASATVPGTNNSSHTTTTTTSSSSDRLVRSSSNRSDSVSSNASASTSIRSSASSSSISSLSGAAAGSNSQGRRVTPLYNLGFHQLLPTVITDAGTDEKIAKFLKKGIEIIGFAILDPIDNRLPRPPSSSTATDSSMPITRGGAGTVSLTSGTPGTGLLSKFKRLSFKPSSSTSPSSLSTSSSSRVSMDTIASSNVVSLDSNPKQATGFSKNIPRGYSFVLRRLIKSESTATSSSSLNSIEFEWKRSSKKQRHQRNESDRTELGSPSSRSNRKASISDSNRRNSTTLTGPSNTSGLERRQSISTTTCDRTRFETTRNEILSSTTVRERSKSISLAVIGDEKDEEDPNQLVDARFRRTRGHSLSVPGMDASTGRRTSIDGASSSGGGGGRASRASSTKSNNSSNVSLSGPEPSTSSHTHDETGKVDDDEEEESDLEDSDRPWTFTLSSSTLNQPIVLASLIPAPHHPRLVAHLSLPLRTKPIRIDHDVCFSVEDLKDVIAVTSLWVILKDGLGGVGITNKKKSSGKGGSEGGRASFDFTR